MREEYDYTDKKIVWDHKFAQFFFQEPDKPVSEYSSGFFHEINDFCPRIMTNKEKWRYNPRESTQVVGYWSPSQKFHNIYKRQRTYEDHDVSHFATNSRTPSPKARSVHQVLADLEEDPKEDLNEDPDEDPNEDFEWDMEEDSNIDPSDVMLEDPDYNARHD